MIKLIIFDLDGTLIDSLPDLTDATNFMRSGFNLPELSQEEVRTLVGEGARRLVEGALPGFDQAEQQTGLQCFLDFNFRHIADKTRLYPGVPETLESLKRDGYILAVASNKSESHCKEILRVLEISHFFSAVLGADSVVERKPSPEPIFHLLKQFDVSRDETVMVGDSINDIAAGTSAGVLTIGCEFGYGTADELQGAAHTISTLKQVILILKT